MADKLINWFQWSQLSGFNKYLLLLNYKGYIFVLVILKCCLFQENCKDANNMYKYSALSIRNKILILQFLEL